ncbi:hypothetical protein Ancab_039666 [Ancistrocladus abbreviatus]
MPKGVVRKLDKMRRKFLWNGVDKERFMAWVNWSTVCLARARGGLGICNFALFNEALLGKWWWRYLTDDDSFWAKFMRAKYGVQWLTSTVSRGSVFSRWVLDLKRTVGSWMPSLLRRQLGNGESTMFWLDRWTSDGPLQSSLPRLFLLASDRDCSVAASGFWQGQQWHWNFSWRRPLFDRELGWVNHLQALVGSSQLHRHRSDGWTWDLSKDGCFTVQAAYRFLNDGFHFPNLVMLTLIWKAKIPVKVQVFIWRAANDAIQTRHQLFNRGVLSRDNVLLCERCGLQVEDIDHVLLRCTYAYDVWRQVCGWWGVQTVCGPLWVNLFLPCQSRVRRKRRQIWVIIFGATIWALWLSRNALIFRREEISVEKLVDSIRFISFDWARFRCKWGGFSCVEWECNPSMCFS